MKDKALKLAKRGIKVFPLIPNEKRPATKNGFKDATSDLQTVNEMWDLNPKANIGIPTGKVNNLTVIDVDTKKVPYELKGLYAFIVATPNGYHLYFKYNENLRQTTGLLDKVDVRNDGGYVVGAGSIVDGLEYEVIGVEKLKEIPQTILDLQKQPEPYMTPCVGNLMEGSRNDTLSRFGGMLRKQGADEQSIIEVLLNTNQSLCDPPLDDKEVERIASSVARYEIEPDTGDELENDYSTGSIKVNNLADKAYKFLIDNDKVFGTPTGIEGLDKIIVGLREGEVIAVNAAAKTGKSTLIHQIIYNLIKRDIPIGYASREMFPAQEVLPNLLSIEYKKDIREYKLTKQVIKDTIEPWPLWFSEGYGQFPLEYASAWMKRLQEDHGVKHFFFDHLHHMTTSEDWQEVVKLARGIKKASMKLGVCTIIIIQPPQIMEGQSLGLKTLRGGAGVGQAIDTVITLERQQGHRNIRKLSVTDSRSAVVRKQISKLKSNNIHLKYNPETTGMEEVEFKQDLMTGSNDQSSPATFEELDQRFKTFD